jgi:hypothetical protein
MWKTDEDFIRHQSSCHSTKFLPQHKPTIPSQPTVTSFVLPNVPISEVLALPDKVVEKLAKDLRPLSAVEGKGFRYICQSMINFLHKNSSVS